MRRLAALALAGAAAFGPAAAAGTGYPRQCGGTVDVHCWEYHCRAVDCFRYDCVLYVDPHETLPVCVSLVGVS